MGEWRHWSPRRSTWPSAMFGSNRKKNCEKILWKNAPISSLGYGDSEEKRKKLMKSHSLAKISEHCFTIFSHNFYFDASQTWLKVTCSFVATNDVTLPWSFSISVSSKCKIHWTCGEPSGERRSLVFPRLICRFDLQGESSRLAGYLKIFEHKFTYHSRYLRQGIARV